MRSMIALLAGASLSSFALAGGTPFPTPTPEPLTASFSFDASSEGWIFASPEMFTLPSARHRDGVLEIVTTDNHNNYGAWSSPGIVLGTAEHNTVGELMFRANYTVTSDQLDAAQVPTFRIYTSNIDFQQSTVLVSTSEGNGDFSPKASGHDYTLYLSQGSGIQRNCQLHFDVLNILSADAPSASLTLDKASIVSLGEPNFRDGDLLLDLGFANDSHGFFTRDAYPALGVPNYRATARGLEVTGNANSAEILFGYWGTDSDVTFEAGKLYKVSFLVSSNARDGRVLPPFRLRVNDSSQKFSQYVNVESTGNGANSPTVDIPLTYNLWLTPQPELLGERLSFAFDYIYVPGNGNDPTVALTLERLTVTAFPAP